MWPHTKGLGVQLSYGLEGPSLHLEGLDARRPWKSARSSNSGLDLRKVKNSTLKLVPPQIGVTTEEGEDPDKTFKHFTTLKHHVGEDIVESGIKSGRHLRSPFIYDASTNGKLLDFGTIEKYNSTTTHDIFAYASGSRQSQLFVQIKTERTELVTASKDDSDDNDDEEVEEKKEEDGHNTDDNTSSQRSNAEKYMKVKKLHPANFGAGSMLELDSEICQIEISKSAADSHVCKNIVFVRTAASVYVIRVKVIVKKTSTEIDLSIIIRIQYMEYFEHKFAHVAYCPFNNSQFAVIDTRNNWIVFRIGGDLVHVMRRGDVNLPEDLSNFKRIFWANNKDELLIMGRTYVKRIHLVLRKTTDIISATKLSFVRDYKMCDANDDVGFLLTSRELMWIDTSEGFERILSWKHFLNEDDPSLTMNHVTVDGDIHIISIQSQLIPAVIIFQFKLEDGFPMSIHDPILYVTTTSSKTLSHLILPVKRDYFSIFKISDTLEITKALLSTKDCEAITKNMKVEEYGIQPPEFPELFNIVSALNEKGILKVHNKFFHVPKIKPDSTDDTKTFQDFALSFEIDKSAAFEPTSLKALAKKELGDFNSFDEYDNMIEQLIEHYKSNGYEHISFADPFKLIKKKNSKVPSSGAAELSKFLFAQWRSSVLARIATKDNTLSATIIYDPIHEAENFEKKFNKLPNNLKDWVSKWDTLDDLLAEDVGKPSNKKLDKYKEQEKPSIQLSQALPSSQAESQSQLKRASSSRMMNINRLSQRMSQPTSSQISSSQLGPKKKKKKKMKGFA